jgi:tyrosyl-tRNA synthetase
MTRSWNLKNHTTKTLVLREAHRALARELTSLVHSEETTQRVEAAARALFGQGELSELDEATLASALAELPRTTISASEEIPTWVDLLAATGVVDSKSAARRIVKEGGAYLNNEKISGEDFRPSKNRLFIAENMRFCEKVSEISLPSN